MQIALSLELLLLHDSNALSKQQEAVYRLVGTDRGVSKIKSYPLTDNLIDVADASILSLDEKDRLFKGKPVYKWEDLSLTFFYPVINHEKNRQPLSLIALYGDSSFLAESIRNEQVYYYGLYFIFGLGFVAISLWFAFRVTAPLIYLSEITKNIAYGDSSSSITRNLEGEAGEIAQNLNLMIARLNAAHDELESYTKNLEHIIELRTQRLNKALEEIYKQKEYVENIISTVGALIVLLDKEGRIMLFNRTAEETLGYKEAEVLGRLPWDIYVSEDNISLAIDSFKKAIDDPKDSIKIEIKMTAKGGAKKTVLWHTTVIKENENIRYLLATGLDISEKKRLEQYITEAQRFQSISTMLSGLSHNFNNLLVGIMGYAGLVRLRLPSMGGGEDVQEVGKYLDIIENSSQKAADLIKHIRGFTKRTEYEKSPININELIINIYALAAVAFPGNIRIETDLADDLSLVRADKLNMQQALMNICINAKEAIAEGGVIRIATKNVHIKSGSVNMLPEGWYVMTTISDSGSGIDEAAISRIFEPFFTTKSMIDHMGLGLTQSYSIITDHRGDITVESSKDKGATFVIYLPVV